jgi:hypothetical protein
MIDIDGLIGLHMKRLKGRRAAIRSRLVHFIFDHPNFGELVTLRIFGRLSLPEKRYSSSGIKDDEAITCPREDHR